MEQLVITRTWRYGRDRQGRTLMLHAGTYRIGPDVSEEVAERARRAGVGLRQPIATTTTKPTWTRGRGRKMQGGAPENKMLGGADENKAHGTRNADAEVD